MQPEKYTHAYQHRDRRRTHARRHEGLGAQDQARGRGTRLADAGAPQAAAADQDLARQGSVAGQPRKTEDGCVILVDSSVWIDYLRGVETRQTNCLDGLLGTEPLAIGDLILTEVLQGTTTDKELRDVLRLLGSLDVVQLGGQAVAVQAARNFRALREKGVTVRKTIDCLIATRCIVDGLTLLHSDRDFEPFVVHLGLRSVF